MWSSTLVLILTIVVAGVFGLENGLVRTPPMGWLSWERFRCVTDCTNYPDECISEKLYKDMADRIVADGYLEAGYEYVIIDDCWLESERDENGLLQANKERFPSGIKALADYMHSRGLKLGIYEDFGTTTCAGYPGVLGHLEDDAKTFASWEVDYVKLDGCSADPHTMDEGYPEFGRYLLATNRSIVYSCSWPDYQRIVGIKPNYTLIAEHCNLWRNFDDIDDSWASFTSIVDYYIVQQDNVAPAAGPGHWNDPDMLIIGNFGLSLEQSKAQMAIWAILSAPLLMSNDLRNIRPEFREILLNRNVIKVNQDSLGIQGRRVYKVNDIEIWTKPIEPVINGRYSYAIAAVSRRTDGTKYSVEVSLRELGLADDQAYSLTELFSGTGPVEVPANGTFHFRIPPTGGLIFLAAQGDGVNVDKINRKTLEMSPEVINMLRKD